eukprot:6332424-Alexandrium_andersonii.AAC.1
MAGAGTKDDEPIVFSSDLRGRLREARERDEPCRSLMQQQRGVKGGKLTPALAANYRLAPDGVLERRVRLASAV